MITGVVITKNEEENISRCLSSLSWCDEIIVVDDYSLDRTELIAQKQGAKIFKRHLQNDYASQRNFAFSHCHTDWVLFLDADEYISPELSQEIRKQIAKGLYDAFFIKRIDILFGQKIVYGEAGNIKLLRLAKRNCGMWRGNVHEEWHCKGKIGQLKNFLIHYPHKSIFSFIKKINSYTTIKALELHSSGVKFNFSELLGKSTGKFFINFVVKLGFLDGMRGFEYALLMSLHSIMVRVKTYELEIFHDQNT